MLMTEEEAKGKWCPYARVTHFTSATPAAPSETTYLGNRDSGGLEMGACTKCIGSACMAWRQIGGDSETVHFNEMGRRPEGDGWVCDLPDTGREAFVLKSKWSRPEKLRGYCGLAGTPSAT